MWIQHVIEKADKNLLQKCSRCGIVILNLKHLDVLLNSIPPGIIYMEELANGNFQIIKKEPMYFDTCFRELKKHPGYV